MSHPLLPAPRHRADALTPAQRVHLALAEAEFARLTPLLAGAPAGGVSGHQWQVASCLASAVADQVQRIVDLAQDPAGVTIQVWRILVRRLRDAAARFEVAVDLAELAATVTGGLTAGRLAGFPGNVLR